MAAPLSRLQQQARRLEALVDADPALATLLADVRKLIALEERDAQQAAAAALPDGAAAPVSALPSAPSAEAESADCGTGASVSSSSSSSSSSWATVTSAPTAPSDAGASWLLAAPAAPSSSSSSSSSSAGWRETAGFRVGSRVEALRRVATASSWYPGVVVAAHAGGALTVRFFASPGAASAAGASDAGAGSSLLQLVADPAAQMRPLLAQGSSPAEGDVRAGARFAAKWPVDGQWYEAVVDEVVGAATTGALFRITYMGYGNSEIVPRELLVRLPPGAGAGAGAAAAAGASFVAAAGVAAPAQVAGAGAAAGVAAGAGTGASGGGGAEGEGAEEAEEPGLYAGLAIPDNLRLLPTDTDAEKLRKRKRVKALKHAWRARKQEEGAAAKQAGWQSFQAKRQRTA